MDPKKTEFSPEVRDRITRALNSKGVTIKCPMCGQMKLSIVDGYFNQTIQTHFQGLVFGGRTIPSAVLACLHCGFLSQHSLGVLGLLPQEKSDDENKAQGAQKS